TRSCSSLSMITCTKRSGWRWAWPTLGREIWLGVISGAVTMKMISSTSMTSMNGTMLISFIVRRPRPRPASLAMVCGSSVGGGAGRGAGAQVALQDVGELFHKGFQAVGDAVDGVREAVVGHDGGDGGEQADG